MRWGLQLTQKFKNMPKINNKIIFSLPFQIIEEIERLMREEKKTRNELLREAIKRYIEEKEWKKIFRYGENRTKRLGIKKGDVEKLIDEVREERRKN